MWLNDNKINATELGTYRESLLRATPNHIVIDHLFNEEKLKQVVSLLHQEHRWQTQKHTYSALYVDKEQWQTTHIEERFVQREIWQNQAGCANSSIAQDLLGFLRSKEFMAVLSRIFNVTITDMNVASPEINTNFFRLGAKDFVKQHADDSPGREICMLLYLNKDWNLNSGGELVFIGKDDKPVSIAPLYNRCVLFDPSSIGSEHWVKMLNSQELIGYRYNVVSWYWSE
ncbi:MAG: 2OG-Fe(II) oxygenase [Methyloprofundus sp.]|nr:2OG-Fe(II) oxygenase [Methyloprofundus sp.]